MDSQTRNELQEDCFVSNIRDEFTNSLSQMINEFDLTFEYISKDVIKKLHMYLTKCKNDESYFDEQNKCLIEQVRPFEDDVFYIATNEGKIKTSQFDFLEKLCLFDKLVDFSLFKNENKNTKRELVKYINNLYMSAWFLTIGDNMPVEDIASELTKFVNDIKLRNQSKEQETNKGKKNKTRSAPNTQADMFGNVFDQMLGNPELFKMAADISSDLRQQNMNPLTLLSSIMSGKPNDQINNFMKNVTSKVEEKINNGEINKDQLEKQAMNIMSAVQSSDISSQIPMLQKILSSNVLKKPM